MSSKYESTENRIENTSDIPRKSKFIYVLTFISTIGGFLFGYDTGVVSGAMLLVREEFSLSIAWHEALVSVTIGAAWIFALIGGCLTDKYGRKPVILLASLIFTTGSVVMGLATQKIMLLIGRIIVGIGIGMVSVAVPIYIAECALPEIRGRLVTVNNLCITGGQFIASVTCGAFSTQSDGWRYMLGLAGIPATLQFFSFLGMPETPRWLVSKKKYEEAARTLQTIRGKDFPIQEEFDTIKRSCLEQQTEMTLQESVGSSQTLCSQVLTSPNTSRALFVGSFLLSLQQLCGINTVMYYSASIIQMAGVESHSLAIWLSSVVAAVNFFCTFIGLFLVERVGRRPLTLWSLGGVVISLVTLGIGFRLMGMGSPVVSAIGDKACGSASTCASCVDTTVTRCGFCYFDVSGKVVNGSCWSQNFNQPGAKSGPCSNETALHSDDNLKWVPEWCPSHYSWFTVTALGVYLLFFAPGMGPMPWTINSEIYPMWARSFCNSVATSFCWMFNLLVSMTFLTLTEILTKEGAFYLYAGIAAVGFVVLLIVLPETKGKSLEEMEALFSGPLFSRSSHCDSRSVQYVHIHGINWRRRRNVDTSGDSDD